MLNAFHILILAAMQSIVMLLVLSSLLGGRVGGVREWMAANMLGCTAFLLYAYSRGLPPLLAYEIANAIYAAAAAMLLAGFCRFFGRNVPYVALATGVALVAAAVAFFHHHVNSFAGRTTVVSIFQVVIGVAIAYIVIRSRKARRSRYPYFFVTATAVSVAIGHAMRAVLHIVHNSELTSLWQLSPVNLMFLSAGTMVLPVMTLGAVMMVHDRMVGRAEHAANRDFLTGAWSRRAFFSQVEMELARVKKSGGALSLLMLDVDRFKSINDRFGHVVGDQVLTEVVARALGAIREVDYLGRIGGEEFAVLLPAADLHAALAVAERVRACVAGQLPVTEPGRQEGSMAEFTVSIGAARLREDETLTQWLQRADAALYRAKENGRNRVEYEPQPLLAATVPPVRSTQSAIPA